MIAPVPAPWFAKRIRRGLAALVALRLEGHPAADMVEATAQVWVQALWPGRVWEEAADSGRIGETFRQITLHETRWPAPAVFLRYLPAREALPALPAPAMTAEQKAANKARLQAMLDKLTGKFTGGGEMTAPTFAPAAGASVTHCPPRGLRAPLGGHAAREDNGEVER